VTATILDPSPPSIARAAAALRAGRLVAFPTETVYGLGADAENPDAVRAIFAAKGRPADHPLIVHVARNADLRRWAREVPLQAQQLMAAFWPGPLTLILPRADSVPAVVAGGQDSIGVRCPSHPVAQALLAAFKNGQGGIAGPSANRFGHVSPTTAQHVIDEFGSSNESPLACVLDGGQSEVGIESTIIDLSRLETHGPVLLRPGRISAAQIAEVLGQLPALPDRAAPRVSGSLDAHYAPRTPLALADTGQLPELLQHLAARGRRFALMHYTVIKDPAALAAVKLTFIAAGISVIKPGTATVSAPEIEHERAVFAGQLPVPKGSRVSAETAVLLRAQWRRQLLTVGFTNGCFDLFHPGHVALLRETARQCDRLIVGLNSDASVRRLKGETRPVQNEEARAEILGAIGHVDLVVVFDEDTPLDLIARLEPDLLTKGADYRIEDIVGGDIVRQNGGRVLTIDLVPGHSSTRLINGR